MERDSEPRKRDPSRCPGLPWEPKVCPAKPTLVADYRDEDKQRVRYCESCARAIGDRLRAVGRSFWLTGLPVVEGAPVGARRNFGAPDKVAVTTSVTTSVTTAGATDGATEA